METADRGGLIEALNLVPDYDCTTLLNNFLNADDENMLNIQLESKYFDFPSFCSKFSKSKKPLYLSINIQSLMSKLDSLKSFVLECNNASIPIDVIALQETWSIKYIELVHIPGFQNLLHSERKDSRGGGVGLYIREGLQFDKIDLLSTFTEKTFESLTVELHYPNKKLLYLQYTDLLTPPEPCCR